MKRPFKVCANVVSGYAVIQYGFVDYTYAVSKKQAVSNLQHRHGITLRDAVVTQLDENQLTLEEAMQCS